MNKLKVYVGCSLNGASSDFTKEVNELKKSLREFYEVLDFVGVNDATPEVIVSHDLGCVKECDYMIAICDHPSTGLGIEIGTANSLGKPILLLAKNEGISKMVRGNHVENPKSEFQTYSDINEIPKLFESFIQ